MSKGRIRRWSLLGVLATAASLLWPVVAMATAPPSPTLRKTAPAALGYAVIFLLLLVVLTISLLPSKRSHQE